MFKKTMKFDDLDGEEVTQTFYFNYNKKEIAELLEFGRILKFPPRAGVTYLPLEKQLEKLTTDTEESGLSNQENNEMAYEIFQNLLLDAYGVKGEDNVSFDKTPELRHYWSTHVAFVELIFEFLESPALAAEFIEKCLPPRMVAKAKEEMVAESKGRISEGTLSEMVQEADRRQKDPATRIEPGPEAAREALGSSPAMEKAAQAIAADTAGAAETKSEDLSTQDILSMNDEEFKKLDPQKLSPEQLMAAFKRKTKA